MLFLLCSFGYANTYGHSDCVSVFHEVIRIVQLKTFNPPSISLPYTNGHAVTERPCRYSLKITRCLQGSSPRNYPCDKLERYQSCYLLCMYICVSVSPSLPLVHVGQLLRCADKRNVNNYYCNEGIHRKEQLAS